MKNISFLLACALLAACSGGSNPNNSKAVATSSNYNHLYDFGRSTFNSEHTNAIALNKKTLAVGTTIRGFTDIRHISISTIDPFTGLPITNSQEYRGDSISTIADDLVQSMAKPEWVVAAGSYPAYSEPNIGIVVFETDPQSGAVSWTRHLGAIGSDLRAKAIIRNEKQQIYYLMGEYDYVENDQGFREMYLCALDKAGTPRWERHYRDPINEANFQSSDLIYHPEKNIITITSKLSKAGKMLGASVTHINPNDGDIINTFRISEIDGNPDIRINDAIDARERTVLVGELNEEPTRSFLLVFEPGKVPTSVLSKIYAADNKFNLRISGVRQHAEGLLYASFDYQRSSSQPNPGLLELKNTGDLTASYIYQVPDYEESIGLLTTYDQKGLVIKGTTGFAKDNALLSLVGVNSPLKDDEKICSKRIDVLVSSGAKVEKYELKALELDASFETEMVVNKGKAEVRPCRQ